MRAHHIRTAVWATIAAGLSCSCASDSRSPTGAFSAGNGGNGPLAGERDGRGGNVRDSRDGGVQADRAAGPNADVEIDSDAGAAHSAAMDAGVEVCPESLWPSNGDWVALACYCPEDRPVPCAASGEKAIELTDGVVTVERGCGYDSVSYGSGFYSSLMIWYFDGATGELTGVHESTDTGGLTAGTVRPLACETEKFSCSTSEGAPDYQTRCTSCSADEDCAGAPCVFGLCVLDACADNDPTGTVGPTRPGCPCTATEMRCCEDHPPQATRCDSGSWGRLSVADECLVDAGAALPAVACGTF